MLDTLLTEMVCPPALDTLLTEMVCPPALVMTTSHDHVYQVSVMGGELTVVQGRVVGDEGELRSLTTH